MTMCRNVMKCTCIPAIYSKKNLRTIKMTGSITLLVVARKHRSILKSMKKKRYQIIKISPLLSENEKKRFLKGSDLRFCMKNSG